jgi:hypothetical protein
MKTLLALLVAALGVAAGQNEDAEAFKRLASIEGKVLSAHTGEAVAKATVRLYPIEQPADGAALEYVAAADAAGAFIIERITPGAYRLRAEQTGYVAMEYGARNPRLPGATLRLAAGQRLDLREFRLTPQGVITGRILNEDREPMARIQITALRHRFVNGRRSLREAGTAITDDLGEYRLFGLAPARYYLSAHRGPGQQDGEAESAYLPTYFPGVIDQQSAAALEVGAGAELKMDMVMRPSPVVRIRGRVINATGAAPEGPIHVVAVPSDQQFPIGGINPTGAGGPENRFEFRGAPPGSYDISALIRSRGATYSALRRVNVGDRGVDDLILEVRPGVDIRGLIRVKDVDDFKFTEMIAGLYPDGMPGGRMFGPPQPVSVAADGTFTITNTAPSQYVFGLRGLPAGFYIESVRLGGEEALEAGADLTSGAAPPIEVVISPKAGSLAGAVTGDQEKPVMGATVVLIPESTRRRVRPRFYRVASTDQAGGFVMRDIDPGDYQVYAWEVVENGDWMDPE